LTSFINPGIWLIFPAYNVIVAILLTQNYHPNACNPWLHYNNARKLSAFSWHYYIISILKKQVERTYFTNQAAASSFSFSSFLLFLYYNHSNNY